MLLEKVVEIIFRKRPRRKVPDPSDKYRVPTGDRGLDEDNQHPPEPDGVGGATVELV